MTKQDNPFMNMDFSKFVADAAGRGMDMEALLASQKKNVEALVSAGQVVAEGYQAVVRRQVENLQAAAGTVQQEVGAAGVGGDHNAQLERQTDLLKSGIDQAIRNLRESSQLIHKSQTEALDILGRRAAEGIDEIKDKTGS